jgi:short-subunit dehydrogenase
MSKFAVRSLAESLWLELAPIGVAVTHVAPGFVDSEIRMVDNAGHNTGKKSVEAPWWLVMSAETAARKIVSAIASRRREIVLTGHGKIVVFLARFFRELWFPILRAIKLEARPEPIRR